MRRIEALTGLGALAWLRDQQRTLRRTAEALRAPAEEVPERVEKLLAERRAAEKEIERLRRERRGSSSGDLVAQSREVAGLKVLAVRTEGADQKELRSMVDDLRGKLGSGIVLLAAEQDGKVSLALGVTKDLTDRLKAGDLIRQIAGIVGGRGGGRPDFAQAGGEDAARLDEAFERLYALVEEGAG